MSFKEFVADKEKTVEMSKKVNHIVRFSVLGILVAVILFAVLYPTVLHAKEGTKVLSCGNITVREDLYLYWLSLYKSTYLQKAVLTDQTAIDSEEFWNRDDGNGSTLGTGVREAADQWIKRIIYAACLFDEQGYTIGEKTYLGLDSVQQSVLKYELNTEKAYNREAGKIGFAYDTLRRAILWQTEAETFVGNLSDSDYLLFCQEAEKGVTVHSSLQEFADFVTLPVNSMLYASLTPSV